MKGFRSFFKKEITELTRSKKLLIFTLLFLLIGVMNPLVAKLTPKIYESMSDQLAEQGLTIGKIKVTAMDSWTQFSKNIPMGLIASVILFSSIFTNEYSKGTLIPLLTKGLSRTSAVLAKTFTMLLVWTAGMWTAFGVTYGYTAYYWDNSTVNNLGAAGLCWWMYGVFMLCLIVFFSSFAGSGGQVLLGVGGVYFMIMMIGMFAKDAADYLPTKLTDSGTMFALSAYDNSADFAFSITGGVSIMLILLSLSITKRRSL